MQKDEGVTPAQKFFQKIVPAVFLLVSIVGGER